MKAPVDLYVSSERRCFHMTKLAFVPDSAGTTLRPSKLFGTSVTAFCLTAITG